ncbi:MAG: hypothetical protein MPW15_20865 [Candidatus Manganitrophus sp.]|nr:hypothetical protein [Candidatus Manganitrophus sp.]
MNLILPRPARVETERHLRIAVILLISFFWLPSAAWGEEKITVEIEGVEGELLENVQAYLRLEKPPSPLTESTLRRLYRQAPEEIHQALQALGYYQPQIESELTRAEERWIARFKIDPGPPVRVARIDLTVTGEGKGDPAFDEPSGGDSAPGRRNVLHHGEYERTKEMLQNLAAERGYFDARFMTHRAAVDLRAKTRPPWRSISLRDRATTSERSVLNKRSRHSIPASSPVSSLSSRESPTMPIRSSPSTAFWSTAPILPGSICGRFGKRRPIIRCRSKSPRSRGNNMRSRWGSATAPTPVPARFWAGITTGSTNGATVSTRSWSSPFSDKASPPIIKFRSGGRRPTRSISRPASNGRRPRQPSPVSEKSG